MSKVTDAFDQGQAAYLRGDTTDMNPYGDTTDDRWCEWLDGWYDTDEDVTGIVHE